MCRENKYFDPPKEKHILVRTYYFSKRNDISKLLAHESYLFNEPYVIVICDINMYQSKKKVNILLCISGRIK